VVSIQIIKINQFTSYDWYLRYRNYFTNKFIGLLQCLNKQVIMLTCAEIQT